jgi:hypothetical protein
MIRPGERLEPWWLERQLDPAGPDFVPGTSRENISHRSWTVLGSLGSRARAAVDPRGMVTPTDGGWSIDWWVGADDRWHLPSREVAVRQRLVGDSPVVETAMRVPGGDAVHRAYGFRSGDDDFVTIEIVNDTAIPFAVAISVRPANPLGEAMIDRVDLVGEVVHVNGRPAIFLPKPPARLAASSDDQTDVVHAVIDGMAAAEWPGPITDKSGQASAAFIFPLPHTASLRVIVPVSGPAGQAPAAVPSAEQVASGWAAQTSSACRIEVPDDRLMAAFTAGRRHLLLAHGGDDVAGWPARTPSWEEIDSIVVALDHLGHHGEAQQLLAGLADRQAMDGSIVDGGHGRRSTNGAALHALAEHWALTRDDDLIETLVGTVAKAGHWIEKRRTSRRARLTDGPLVDAIWSAAGLRNASPMLRIIGQPDVAEDFERFADSLLADIDAAAVCAHDRTGAAVLPSTFAGEVDARLADNLIARVLDLVASGDARLDATAEWVRLHLDVDGAVFDGADRLGLSPINTLRLAACELAQNEPRAFGRLSRVLDLASPTWTLSEVVHPRTGGGSTGDGQHAASIAELCSFVRRLLVWERGDELILGSVVPETWWGTGWEAHEVPTRFGRFGYAVRWHGDRPALLWELHPHPGIALPRLRLPGLDPSWVGDGAVGEALLAPVQPPGDVTESEPASTRSDDQGSR